MSSDENEDLIDHLEPVLKMDRDLRRAGALLSKREARYMVDTYYQMQKFRIATAHQVRETEKAGEPNTTIQWIQTQFKVLEGEVKKALTAFVGSQPLSEWPLSVVGIGPVIVAGLLSHIDLSKMNKHTAGGIWKFAGMDPTSDKQVKGERRAYNAKLRVVCWKAGESFVKFKGRPDCFYGHEYEKRKQELVAINLAGGYSDQAAEIAERWRRNNKTKSESYKWYSARHIPQHWPPEGGWSDDDKKKIKLLKPGQGMPMLPPGHIHSRARRAAVKLFLAHLFEYMYEETYHRPPPYPYPIRRLGHEHYIARPGAKPRKKTTKKKTTKKATKKKSTKKKVSKKKKRGS